MNDSCNVSSLFLERLDHFDIKIELPIFNAEIQNNRYTFTLNFIHSSKIKRIRFYTESLVSTYRLGRLYVHLFGSVIGWTTYFSIRLFWIGCLSYFRFTLPMCIIWIIFCQIPKRQCLTQFYQSNSNVTHIYQDDKNNQVLHIQK